MGLILPQLVEVTLSGNRFEYFEKLGYKLSEHLDSEGRKRYIKGQKIIVHVLDLSEGSNSKVKIQCDCCGKIYERPYGSLKNSYCLDQIGKIFCKNCVRTEMSKYGINTQEIWRIEEYALSQLKEYIDKHGTLKGWTVNDKDGNRINTSLKKHGYNLEDMCKKLGYDYLELKGVKFKEEYFYDYNNLKLEIRSFINKYGYFPTQNNMKQDIGMPLSAIQRFGGSEKIKDDIGYTNNEYIDDYGFRNRSHYEYIVAQFLIHNSVSYKREQHPFPKPNQNLRSDFTFETIEGVVYHLEVWGYKEEDSNGKRSQMYCKRKRIKKELYKKYKINLISVENDIFSNSFDKIQTKLRELLKDILNKDLKIINHNYLTDPNKMSDYELFNEIMGLSNDSMTLPKESDFTEENKSLFYEALKRYGNYNTFAKQFNVVTNRKRNHWDEKSVLNTMVNIKLKYGFMPTANFIKHNLKTDSLFCGLTDAIKLAYSSTIDAYLTLYEHCDINNITLGTNDISYLKNILSGNFFHSSDISEEIKERAFRILNSSSSFNIQLERK